jgi:uncharacterized protein
MRRMNVLVVLLCLGLVSPVFAQGDAPPAAAGRWEGGISIMGTRLGMVVTLTASGAVWAGAVDIPQQRAKGIPLANVRVEGATVHFELAGSAGVAVFDGTRKGDLIEGSFSQGGMQGTFDLARGAEAAARAAAVRAAEAKAAAAAGPVPYKAEDVTYPSGAISLACTLTLPASAGRHAAVLLVTGSGAQDRDEEVFGFKVFRLIADHLTRKDIAVLRCDDRGVGGSGGNMAVATTANFADDALAGVEYLKTRADIDPARIGILGHSEGGLVAPMVASRSTDVAFIILMSGPGQTGEGVLLSQAALIQRIAGATADEIARKAALQRRVFAAVRSGSGWPELEAQMRKEFRTTWEQLPEQQRASLGNADAFAADQVAGQLAGVRSPWFRYFIDADPAAWLSRTHCPVLAIFGGKDVQVDARPNQAAVERALKQGGNTHVRVETFPEANHLYQKAGTGMVDEYARLEKAFVPGFLDLLSTWIAAQPPAAR